MKDFAKINGATSLLFASLAFVVTVGCNSLSLKTDQKAKDAVGALKKLEASVETGISYKDYSLALGSANFSVKQYTDSAKATSVELIQN